MIQALRNAIYTTGLTCTGFSSSNFYFNEVPEGSSYPYCVFNDVTDFVTRDSATDFENCDIQFVFYSDVLTEIETMQTNLKTKFDYGKSNLSVSGYTVIESVRTFEMQITKLDKIYSSIIQYRITISKAR